MSVPSSCRRPPTSSTDAIATMPKNSIAGKKSELSHCANWFVRRFAMLASSNSARNARSRLNAWTTAMPATDSAICAVIAGDRVPHLEERRVRAHLEPAREHERRRQDHERDEPEPPVEDEEADHGGDERQRVGDERRQSLREDVRDRVDVRREPRDDPAGALLGEVAERQRGQVLEEMLAQREHDRLADAREAADHRRREHPRGRVDARGR